MITPDTVVVYYSLSGNTASVAQQIAQRIGADMIEIQTVTPYTGTYDDIVAQGQREVAAGFTPDIKPVDVSAYSHVFVGSPTWWYKMAPAVLTFLRGTDFTGKTATAFSTNAGWAGTVVADMSHEMQLRGATTTTPIAVEFSDHTMTTNKETIDKWIDSNK